MASESDPSASTPTVQAPTQFKRGSLTILEPESRKKQWWSDDSGCHSGTSHTCSTSVTSPLSQGRQSEQSLDSITSSVSSKDILSAAREPSEPAESSQCGSQKPDRHCGYDADSESDDDDDDDDDDEREDHKSSNDRDQREPSLQPHFHFQKLRRVSSFKSSLRRILSAPAAPRPSETDPPQLHSWQGLARHLAQRRETNGELTWTPAHMSLARTKTRLFLAALAQAKADEREAAAQWEEELFEDLRTRSAKALHAQGLRHVSREEIRARRRLRAQMHKVTSEREKNAVRAEIEDEREGLRRGRSRTRVHVGCECSVQAQMQSGLRVRWAKLPTRADTF